MKIIHRTFYGESKMREAINALITASQWFQVEPWPNDEWVISVKKENERLLNTI